MSEIEGDEESKVGGLDNELTSLGGINSDPAIS